MSVSRVNVKSLMPVKVLDDKTIIGVLNRSLEINVFPLEEMTVDGVRGSLTTCPLK